MTGVSRIPTLADIVTGCAAAVALLTLALIDVIPINPWLAAGIGLVSGSAISWTLDQFGLVLTFARFLPPAQPEIRQCTSPVHDASGSAPERCALSEGHEGKCAP